MKSNINKSTLRQSFRAIRDIFGDEFINEASEKACRNLENSAEFQKADTVLLYYPVKNELSPLPLFEIARNGGKRIAFPRCEDNGTLTFRTVSSLCELSEAKFGIFEPEKSAEIVKTNENTLCIVPALAFSRDGARLGYGKGFYDRFLHNFEGFSVGFCYSKLVLDALPTEIHDAPVDAIITESEVLRIAQKD